MLGIAMHTTIQTLWKQGYNKSEIARLTGHDWKTVAKVIKAFESGTTLSEKKSHRCLLDPHREQMLAWIEQGLTGVRIHEELLKASRWVMPP